MSRAFVAAVEAPPARSGAAWWFAFRGDRLLVEATEAAATLPVLPDLGAVGLVPVRVQYLGTLAGLRELYGRLDDDLYALAGRAVQIVEWDRSHQFCGRCGSPTAPLPGERARRCPACGLVSFPRLAPAVIVLIQRGDELLLARGHHFAAGMYGLVAGFVEAGESLEETVAREIREEVGITVANVRYVGSQPWPYPHQLMIGFTAEYAGGELRIDPGEIADAAWFRWDALPRIPAKLSIARRLIDAFVAKQQQELARERSAAR